MTDQIEQLLDDLTLEEMVMLLAGIDAWTTPPIKRLGIPALKVSDGPNGARGGGSLVGGVKAACFPVGIALAATWNPELVQQIGNALAEEAQSKGAHVLLAPTVNMHRSPINGRNFECYSEDPHLASQIAVAYIRGVQERGVGATVKHFVGNESEFQRMTISSEIDERTLRELYLPPFEAAVKQAGVWAVMSAYNKLNGTYASEHHDLMIKLLKDEWGFDGVVMSDWFATHSTVEAANNGLDLEMPGPPIFRGEKLVAAVQDGSVSAEAIKASARRMLVLMQRAGVFDHPEPVEEQAIDRPEHRALARQAAAQAIVLLKNDNALPLQPASLQTLAIIGPNAKTAQIMGGGSAQVNAHYRITPFDGIAAQIGEQVELAYAQGCTNHKMLPLLEQQTSIAYFGNRELAGEPVFQQPLQQGEIMWFGEIAPAVDRMSFSARTTTSWTPKESGTYELGLVSAGVSRLLVDDTLVIDNWSDWRASDNYFGAGSAEIRGTFNAQANRTYTISVEYASPPPGGIGLAALRVGIAPPTSSTMIDDAVALAASADAAIVCVGLTGEWETEGQDRTTLTLAGQQDELVARIAAANPKTIVVLQTGSPITMPWLDAVAGVIQAWYPGQECGNAIADVLFGAVNPGGRLPQTFPQRLEDNPAFINYPGDHGKVRYGENVFIGYRYYETKACTPLFPFGFGLSYTTFGYSNLALQSHDHGVTVTLDVANTGSVAGREVVQVYVRDHAASVQRPIKELKGFANVALAAGEQSSISIELDQRAFAFWDDQQHAWVAEAGTYSILVGGSSDAIQLQTEWTLDTTIIL